jgi:hypothetical protein
MRLSGMKLGAMNANSGGRYFVRNVVAKSAPRDRTRLQLDWEGHRGVLDDM